MCFFSFFTLYFVYDLHINTNTFCPIALSGFHNGQLSVTQHVQFSVRVAPCLDHWCTNCILRNLPTLFLGIKLSRCTSDKSTSPRPTTMPPLQLPSWPHVTMSGRRRCNAYLKSSHLRLNPTKSQLKWRSQQQLAKIDGANVLVLSSTIRIQEAAGDLDVVMDSRLLLCNHVCRIGYASTCNNCDQSSTGLGQRDRAVLRHHRRSDASPSVDPERRRSGTRCISPVLRQLHWLPGRVQGRHPRPPDVVLARSKLPGGGLLPRHQRSSKKSAPGWHSYASRQSDAHQPRQQSLQRS